MYLSANDKKIFAYTGAQPHQEGLESVVFVHGTGMDHTVWLLPAAIRITKFNMKECFMWVILSGNNLSLFIRGPSILFTLR